MKIRIAIVALALCWPGVAAVAAGPRAPYSPYSPPGQGLRGDVYVARQAAPSPPQSALQSAVPADEIQPVPDPSSDGGLQPQSSDFGSFYDEGACYDDSCTVSCGRPGLWYGGVDYLLVRPRLSQGVGYEKSSSVLVEQGQSGTLTTTSESVEFPFQYDSAFRATLGYRFLDCGGDISLTYWRMTGEADLATGPSSAPNGPFFSGAPNNRTGNQSGRFFSANSGITANIFDIDFAKCLSFGGGDPCDCSCCPRWDLRWSAGVRVGDVTRTNHNLITDSEGEFVSNGNIDTRFVGAGPRVSAQGRRFFGPCGNTAAFAKISQALLIGDYRYHALQVGGPTQPTIVPVDVNDKVFSRMIPVTDIEIGASFQLAPCAFVSVGWLFQCWWDLGQSETITDTGALDTANILSFDGLFVHGELLF